MIKLIVAQAKNGVIGNDNVLPWSIKEELQFFKKTTLNQSLLMGRSTFSGIGRVLPERTTYILTRDENFNFVDDNIRVIHDAKELFKKFENSEDILYISGGQSLYEQFYEYADELIISTIKEDYDGDAHFVDIDFNNYDLINKEEFEQFVVNTYRKK